MRKFEKSSATYTMDARITPFVVLMGNCPVFDRVSACCRLIPRRSRRSIDEATFIRTVVPYRDIANCECRNIRFDLVPIKCWHPVAALNVHARRGAVCDAAKMPGEASVV